MAYLVVSYTYNISSGTDCGNDQIPPNLSNIIHHGCRKNTLPGPSRSANNQSSNKKSNKRPPPAPLQQQQQLQQEQQQLQKQHSDYSHNSTSTTMNPPPLGQRPLPCPLPCPRSSLVCSSTEATGFLFSSSGTPGKPCSRMACTTWQRPQVPWRSSPWLESWGSSPTIGFIGSSELIPRVG